MNPGTAIPLLGRQYRALRASWATWALAAIALLFAATSPVTARYLPEILGGIIGWEREQKGRAAGLKTHILVSIGSALFVAVIGLISRSRR